MNLSCSMFNHVTMSVVQVSKKLIVSLRIKITLITDGVGPPNRLLVLILIWSRASLTVLSPISTPISRSSRDHLEIYQHYLSCASHGTAGPRQLEAITNK